MKKSKELSRCQIILAAFGLFCCLVVALTVGLVLHYDKSDDVTVEVIERSRAMIDCYPELRLDKKKMEKNRGACLARGCIYKHVTGSDAPFCHFPDNHGYISLPPKEVNTGYRVQLKRTGTPDMFQGQSPLFDDVIVEVERQTNNRVRIKISPKGVTRWEVPPEALNIEQSSEAGVDVTTTHYNISFSHQPTFGLQIIRKSSGAVVFNTSLPGLILSDQFLQLSSRLPTDRLYGFGEHRHRTFRHDMGWKLWSMFTRDSGPNSDWNLYGHQPVYLNMEQDGSANMVLLKNTNAQEVLLQPNPEPAVTWRTVGGVLDFYVVLGDSPSDVIRHYTKAVGRPLFPPYWSLGYQLSRWGYTNITDMELGINRTIQAGIPYEVQWADIDTFNKHFVFSYDKTNWDGFPDLVNRLEHGHRRFITIVDPGIGIDDSIYNETKQQFPRYDIYGSGVKDGVFVTNSTNGTFLGEVWPGIVAYPDFTNPDSQAWWTRWIRFYRDDVGVKVSALWIDMNEPSNFHTEVSKGATCPRNKWNYPPYTPHIDGASGDGRLYTKTLCMDSQQSWGRHYDVHSLYAHSMALRTYTALQDVFPGKRPWVITRSNFAGTSRWATKWSGDNLAQWDNMHFSIIHLFEYSMFGFSMTGSDICGFWGEATREMCIRWHQLGAFYPMARNHNAKGDVPNLFTHQDPATFGQDFVDIVKPVLMTRQKLLPYLYTLMYLAHERGDTVARPLMFEYPKDENTLTIDKQFMLGPALLISPVLTKGATSVDAYFPKGRWFEYITGEEINSDGEWKNLITPLDKFNLHLRAGSVIPWQEPDVTTHDSRRNDFGLIIALDENGTAEGELFCDDGVSKVTEGSFDHIRFEMKQAGELTIVPTSAWDNPATDLTDVRLRTLEIYGLPRPPSHVTYGNETAASVTVFKHIVTLKIDLPMRGRSTITWT